MRSALLLCLLLLPACGQPAPAPAALPESPCRAHRFEGSRITACALRGGRIEIRTAAASGRPYRSFAAVQAALGDRAGSIAFAMNGGMFDDRGKAIGLLIEDGKRLRAINLRKGRGNFHLLPNGVFLVRANGAAEVVASERFAASKDIRFATQSGPMLVIGGKLHPRFQANGESRNIRNGVGIAPEGTPVFAISEEPVSFGKFARFFRDSVKARDALYFDGSVSALWDPANGRRDSHAQLGPIALVFNPAESAPGRADRATP